MPPQENTTARIVGLHLEHKWLRRTSQPPSVLQSAQCLVKVGAHCVSSGVEASYCSSICKEFFAFVLSPFLPCFLSLFLFGSQFFLFFFFSPSLPIFIRKRFFGFVKCRMKTVSNETCEKLSDMCSELQCVDGFQAKPSLGFVQL